MYQEKNFNLPEMTGLSQKQISTHLALYAGYVKNVNAILEKITEYKKDAERHAIALSEILRRLPFEWNGMRMHEYYFEALGGNGNPSGEIARLLEKEYGSFDSWLSEFKAIGRMRGIGWVVLSHDPQSEKLLNTWVSDHEIGHLAGADILIAMDVWEHAYLVDYTPSERGKYIDAFFANLKWNVVEERLRAARK